MRSILKQWVRYGIVLFAAMALAVGCNDDGTEPGAIALSLNPGTATIPQGGSAPVTAMVTKTGSYTGTPTFSASGAPTGVSATISNVTTTGNVATATVTLQVATTTAPGTYNITVRAQGSGVTDATAVFALTVTPAPDYALSLLATALAIDQGGNNQTTVNITRTNFTGGVTLSLSGAPAGVTGSFDPAVPTGTSSTLTVSVAASVPPGVYNLTVDGTGTPGNRSTPLTLTVNAAPDYALSLSAAALAIDQGGNDQTTVTIARTNFTGAVTLSLGGAPAGVTGSFDPAAPTGTSSTLTVSVAASVAPGVYNLTVDGTGTPGNRSTPLTLTVDAAPDYALSLSAAALAIDQGGNDQTTVTIARTNFTGAVTLSLGGAPAGVTGSFDPAAPTGTSSTLTVRVAASVAPGVYNLTVDGTGTPGNRSTPLTLTVDAAPDYALSLSAAVLTIVQGASAPTTVNITRTSFTDAVTLNLGGAPAGVTGSFDPAAPTGTSSTLTVSVAASVAPGVYNLTVDGTGTPGDRSTPLTLTVDAAPDYALSLSAAALTIVQGASAPTSVTIARTNFTDAVTLSVGGAPAGVTGSFDPAAPTGTTSTLTVSVAASVVPGVYNLTVDGTGTPGNRSTPLTLTVDAAPDYALSLSAAALTIVQGASAPTTVNITRTSFTDAVTLSLGGAPAGVTGSFDPAVPTGTSSTLTVSVAASVAPGVYNLTVDGTGTPGNRSTPLTLTVNSSGGGGNTVTVDFSSCPVADRAAWLAYQDGTGAWTRVTGVNHVYTFNITSSAGGLAYVLIGAGNSSSVQVQYMTKAEFTAVPLQICGASPTLKSVSGTAAGLGLTEAAQISLGGGSALAFFGNLNFLMTGVKAGTHDLVGARRPLDGSAGADRAIIRRDQNIADNGSVGTLDFAGAESFATTSATITVGGLVGGESLSYNMTYHVGATCEAAPLNLLTIAGATFTASGIPAAQQRASDYHNLLIAALTDDNEFRSVTDYFHTLTARTVTLGAPLPAPTVTSLAGPYRRLQATFALPAAYTTSASFGYVDAAGDKSVNLVATFGYLGGSSVTLGLADFSALAGWDNSWAPTSASTGEWTASGIGTTGAPCTENASSKVASMTGTF